MTSEQLSGLVGSTADHLCTQPGVDTGLARGGAIEVVTRAAVESAQYFVPAIGVRDDVTKLSDLDWGITLIGSEQDCKCVINGVEDLLARVIDEKPPAGPAWPQGQLEPGGKSRLSYWTQRTRPHWVSPSRSWVPGPLLVGASGVHGKITGLPPYEPPAELVRNLRTLAVMDGPVLLRFTALAAEGFDYVAAALRSNGLRDDYHLILGRWMCVLAVLAIGVDPASPVVTEDMLALAVGDHSLLLTSFQDAESEQKIAN